MAEESYREQLINKLEEINDPAIFQKVCNLLDQEKQHAEEGRTQEKNIQSFIVEFEKYQSRQGFEHDLINRRVSWLLTSQTILFTALALAMRTDVPRSNRVTFLNTIAWVGILTSILILIGIWAGIRAKYLNYKRFQTKYDSIAKLAEYWQSENRLEWGVKTRLTEIALAPDGLMPVMFTIVWVLILIKFTIPDG